MDFLRDFKQDSVKPLKELSAKEPDKFIRTNALHGPVDYETQIHRSMTNHMKLIFVMRWFYTNGSRMIRELVESIPWDV
ncbi:hypothetical protein LguiA_030754 [Lonicera macranthoides]